MLTDQIISGFLWYGISKAESSDFDVLLTVHLSILS